MIYLFNSAFRTLYLKNVLNTLFLPNGCTNEYRYDINLNIPREKYDDYINIKDNEAVIIFIDRYSACGYKYYPLRLSRIELCEERDKRLYFRVSLGAYIFPIDLESFNVNLKKSLESKGLPKLKANTEDPDDGFYAIQSGSIFNSLRDYYLDDDAWDRCTDAIKKVKKFNEIENNEKFVFLKCNIKDSKSKNSILKPDIVNNKSVFNLIRGQKYYLDISYKYPYQLVNNSSKFKIKINLGENLKSLYQGTSVNIDSSSNNISFPFITKRNLEDFETGLSLSYEKNNEGLEIIGSEYELEFKIKESNSFWIQLVVAIIVFVTAGFIMNTDFSSINPLTISSLIENLWFKILCAILQSGALFWLFKLVGKKFL